MRVLIAAATLAFAVPALAQDSDEGWTGHFVDEYRFGGTYAVIRAATPEACETVCTNSEVCLAWSFTTESLAGDSRCELKHIVGTGEYRPGVISGVSASIFDPARRTYGDANNAAASADEPVEQAAAETPAEDAAPTAPSEKSAAAPQVLTSAAAAATH